MTQLNARGKETLGSGIAFLFVAAAAIALRFYTKTFTKAKWAADDWWISLSLVSFSAWIGIEFWGKKIVVTCDEPPFGSHAKGKTRPVYRRWTRKVIEFYV